MGRTVTRREVIFAGPRRVEVRDAALAGPGPGEVLVGTEVSAISAGTELLFYRGALREGTVLDESLEALREPFRYPVLYGYASVGEVLDGDGAPRGKRVLGFQPHVSHYVAPFDDLYELPEGLSVERAALWPAAETAVNLVLDAGPLVGERVLVIGQGIVGLLTTRLLARFPLARLWSVESIESRRRLSERLGAERALSPEEAAALENFDLVLELSGASAGLNLALASAGFEGRIVVGSWYGEGPVEVDLGTHFHRGRLQLRSSQVSHVGGAQRARWTKRRRMGAAATILAELPVDELITHRFPAERAGRAYELLDGRAGDVLQVLLTYT